MSSTTRRLGSSSDQPPPSGALLPAPSAEGPPGTIGKYEVIERLGAGAMGVVYKCTQPGLDRPVAVKVLVSARHADAAPTRRFRREAWAAARLDHPNVVRVYDVGSDGELPFFVMEYVDGCSLDRLIGTPALTLETTLRLVYHLARALHAAHEQGIIHRDIKPSNVLITRSGQPKLADFGLAKSLHDGRALSNGSDLIGTPRYMAPEQVLGAPEDVDARTDVYALGAVLYEMLTGEPPVDGPNVLAILRKLTDEEPIPVRQRNPAVPEEVAAICARAMAKDRTARLSSAAELADAIQAYLLDMFLRRPTPLAGAPAPELLAALPLALPAPSRPRQPMVFVATSAVLVALTLLGALAGRSWLGPREDLGAWRARLLAGPDGPSPEGQVRDLTAYLDRAPDDTAVRLLRARARRRAGACLAAAADAAEVVRRGPDNLAAHAERLLALYQVHVLYLGNLNEPLLRPRHAELLRADVEALRARGTAGQKQTAELIQALARHDYDEARRLARAAAAGAEGPDECMPVADALWHAAARAYAEEAGAGDDSVKAEKKRQRELLAGLADDALRRGLGAGPHHVGLLFLAANSLQRRADWEIGPNEDRATVLRRQQPALEQACDRLRDAAPGGDLDTVVARAVLLSNAGRDDAALERLRDAPADHSALPYAGTLQTWLRLWAHTEPTLTAREADRLLDGLRQATGASPEDFNTAFVRALLEAAARRWPEAREELRRCRNRLGTDELPASTGAYTDWLVRANASTTEYLDATQVVLWQLPVPADARLAIARALFARLDDARALAEDHVKPERAREVRGWAHYHSARALAAKPDNRAPVLRHVRQALELRVTNLTPSSFRDDGAVGVYNEDKEFKVLYERFAPAP